MIIRVNQTGNILELLQEHIAKASQRCTLTIEEQRRLSNLQAIVDKLTREETVQSRQLQIWLSKSEYTQIEAELQEQLDLR